MKNNVKALIAHFVIVGIAIILLIIFVATGPTLGKYTTHLVIRIPLAIVCIMSYVYGGMLLDATMDKKYDFFVGTFIAIIGIALWVYTFLITGRTLNNVSEELSTYWILFNGYYMPFTMFSFLLGIKMEPIVGLFVNLLPSLLMGIGLSYKRLRIARKIVVEGT